ncbi:MAG: ATP-binding protein [Synergistaceae bacterium]|jgi:predicted AAA+ superfamily ATPase|nr:ATP-binding protein [Synergistaceae bacterium]
MERKITQELTKWKQNSQAKPLVVYGARQVGKTYVIREFGQNRYQNLIEVNFEVEETLSSIFAISLQPKAIIKALEDFYETKIDLDNTLIFFDEIQKCPQALTSLKYFQEEMEQGKAHYQIVAAGSLLGVTLQHEQGGPLDNKKQQATFPVGKVDTLIVYPLDFEEFLWAGKKKFLANQIREGYRQNQALPDILHREALMFYQKFLVVGGMPKVVAAYLASSDYRVEQKVIVDSYSADMTKYTPDRITGLRNQETYRSVAKQLGQEKANKKFIFSDIRKGAKSRDYRGSVWWLAQAHVIIECTKIKAGDMPLLASEETDFFKLYLSDTGLLCYLLAVTQNNLDIFDKTYQGALTENYVACALQNKIQALSARLHYWKASEKTDGAEVDFVISSSGGNIPIEVKSSVNVRSKSLNSFTKRFAPAQVFRVSKRNFGFENGIKSIPLYAAFCIEDMI